MYSKFAVFISVLYISLHRLDIFPGQPDAGHTYVGRGSGEGFNVNIPWFKVTLLAHYVSS